MRRWELLVIGVAACGFEHGTLPEAADAPAVTGWLTGAPYRKPLTITPPTALADFPVSVVFYTDPDLALHASDGNDLAFTAADGTTRLPSEIVAFATATGALDAWVELSLEAGPQTIYLYYGGPPAQQAGDPWADYAGVWHMSGAMNAVDSSRFHDDARAQTSAATPAAQNGIIGGARTYDGTTDTLSAGDPATGALDVGDGSFTVELWVDAATSAANFAIPLWKGGSSLPLPGYDVELGASTWHFEVVDGNQLVAAAFGTQSTLANQWVQLTGVVDRTQQKIFAYVGSELQEMQPLVGVGTLDSASDFQIGRASFPFAGAIDEVRLTRRALPVAWLAAEEQNATARNSFVSVGAEQARP